MPQEKAADEIYCRSCGEVIKKNAEICPECGVRNERAEATSSTQSHGETTAATQTPSAQHDPSQWESTVSENWYYAIAGSTGLWILSLGMSGASASGGAVETVAGLLMLLAWIGMPVGIYFDKKYLRANSKWNPSTLAWVGAAVIPLVNIVAGGIYLYRRHEVLGVP